MCLCFLNWCRVCYNACYAVFFLFFSLTRTQAAQDDLLVRNHDNFLARVCFLLALETKQIVQEYHWLKVGGRFHLTPFWISQRCDKLSKEKAGPCYPNLNILCTCPIMTNQFASRKVSVRGEKQQGSQGPDIYHKEPCLPSWAHMLPASYQACWTHAETPLGIASLGW